MNLLIWLGAAFYLSSCVARGSIFAWLRTLKLVGKWAECQLCNLGLLSVAVIYAERLGNIYVGWVIVGLAVAGYAYALSELQDWAAPFAKRTAALSELATLRTALMELRLDEKMEEVEDNVTD